MATRAENMELSNEGTDLLLQLPPPRPCFKVVKSEKKRLTRQYLVVLLRVMVH
jgi:hypothetical protein